ncbi:MAG: hypothetical protein P8J87_03395 [Verrucomicrobiales bacterium]|nr:hypothetical protein [Verrucomicrobiales bacterium]
MVRLLWGEMVFCGPDRVSQDDQGSPPVGARVEWGMSSRMPPGLKWKPAIDSASWMRVGVVVGCGEGMEWIWISPRRVAVAMRLPSGAKEQEVTRPR